MAVSTVHGRVASRPRLPDNGQFLLARTQAVASASATGLTLLFGDFSDQCGQFRIMLKGLTAATLLSATATNQWQLQFSTDSGVTFLNANYFNTNDAWYTSSTVGHIVNTTASAMNLNGAATQQWESATAVGHGVCGIVEMFNATASGRPSLRHYMHGDGATIVANFLQRILYRERQRTIQCTAIHLWRRHRYENLVRNNRGVGSTRKQWPGVAMSKAGSNQYGTLTYAIDGRPYVQIMLTHEALQEIAHTGQASFEVAVSPSK